MRLSSKPAKPFFIISCNWQSEDVRLIIPKCPYLSYEFDLLYIMANLAQYQLDVNSEDIFRDTFIRYYYNIKLMSTARQLSN